MRRGPWRLGAHVAIGVVALTGCEGQGLSGHAFSVRLTTQLDECADPPADYDEVLEFVVDFQGGEAIAIGTEGAIFATGAIAGCFMTYRTGVWEEERPNGNIRWELEGEALYRLGGTGCELEDGVDWLGTETFTVIASDDPEIEAGCRSILDARGTYIGER